MRSEAIRKVITLITLLVFAVGGSGCYGGFHLTKALYKFNGEIKLNGNEQANHVARSVVMVVLVIVPIYQLAALADALIVNSIEFWTGKNPLLADAQPTMETILRGDERYVQTFIRTASTKEMQIDYYKKGRHVNTLVVRQEENSPAMTAELRWSDGRREAYQVTDTGAEAYLIGHTNALGAQREWMADGVRVANISKHLRTLLASPVAMAAASPALLFQ